MPAKIQQARARIQYGGFDREESVNLKPFLQTADYFARKWNRSVVLDAPHGEGRDVETGDENQRVHVHFFSFPPVSALYDDESLGYARTLFHFPLSIEDLSIPERESPESIYVRGNDVGAKFKARRSYPEIRSPEGSGAAQVVKNHIFILFDLAHRPWEGAIPVFWEILERAQEYLPATQSSSDSIRFSLDAHEMMRAKIMRRKNELLSKFTAVSRLFLEGEYSRIYNLWEKKRDEMMILEAELAEVSMQAEVLGELLDNPKVDEGLLDHRFREEFELLHRQRWFRGIEIHEDELHIFTEPVEHMQSSGAQKMLSQYKIVLRPSDGVASRNSNTFGAIKIVEWGWRGPHYHPETTIKDTFGKDAVAPCFGPEFVKSIFKALADHDYPVLITLLLHFLDSDDRIPTPRPPNLQNKETYEPTPFYLNEHAKNMTCKAYVEFVRRFRGILRKSALKQELARLGTVKEEKWASYEKARKEFALLGIKAHFFRSYIDRLPIAEEFEKLYAISALTNIVIGKDFMWLVFGPGKGIGSFKGVRFLSNFRVLVKPSEGLIRVWDPSSSSAEESFVKERLYSSGDFRQSSKIKQKLARGLFGEALVFLHDILRGQDIDGERDPRDTDLTKELVEQYLLENPFPVFAPPPSPPLQLSYDFAG